MGLRALAGQCLEVSTHGGSVCRHVGVWVMHGSSSFATAAAHQENKRNGSKRQSEYWFFLCTDMPGAVTKPGFPKTSGTLLGYLSGWETQRDCRLKGVSEHQGFTSTLKMCGSAPRYVLHSCMHFANTRRLAAWDLLILGVKVESSRAAQRWICPITSDKSALLQGTAESVMPAHQGLR